MREIHFGNKLSHRLELGKEDKKIKNGKGKEIGDKYFEIENFEKKNRRA